MNVLHHATEDCLGEAQILSRAQVFTKEEWWNDQADWYLAFSRLVSSGRVVKSAGRSSGRSLYRSARVSVLPASVGRWL
jgi:hypothetical protein